MEFRRGQAAIELAILLPVLLVITLGSWDLSRMASNAGVATGQVRAGLRAGAGTATADIGSKVRTAADPEIANTLAVWGSAWTGKADDACTTPGGVCGDPGGCLSGSAFWTTVVGPATTKPVACFAVASCTPTAGTPVTCPPGAWGTRPGAGSAQALDVRVVLHLSPLTPLLGAVTTAGVITVTQDGFATIAY